MATVKWLGTASLELAHDGQILLIDPHLSRLGKWASLTQPIRPDEGKIDRYLAGLEGKVCGILITHAHSDHLQDTPYIAGKLGVPVWGNESVDTLLRLHGLPGCPQVLAGGETVQVGPFAIDAVKTRHGLVALGKVPFPGRIDPQAKPPLRIWKYRHGEPPLLAFVSAGGRTIFHQGTANLIDNLLPERAVDTAWVCVSGHQYTPDFTRRLFSRLHPRRVALFHFEDFSLPLTEVDKYIPGSDPYKFMERVKAVLPEAEVFVPRPLEPLPF